MNEADAQQLIDRYAISWYADVDRIDAARIARSAADAARRDLVEGNALVDAMDGNVREAEEARDGIRARYERAQLDGLFDVDALEAAPKKVSEGWLQAIDVQRGDRGRCIGELKHWREYAVWARAKAGIRLVSPPVAPDSRLPPEREPGDDYDEAAQ